MQACQLSTNKIPTLVSTKNYIDRHKEQLWELEWLLHMQISS